MIKITSDINRLREEIDNIDEKIVELVLKRMKIVHGIGVTKSKNNSRIYVPEREAAIYKKLSALSGISNEEISAFYTEIISFCRKLEGVLDVAVKKDTYSLLGVKKIFGEHIHPIFTENFKSIDTNSIKYILSPLNSEILDFIENENWFIINKTISNNETLYLFSSFENKILEDDNTAIFLTPEKISKNFIEIKSGLFINFSPYKEAQKFKSIKLLGVIPNI